MGKRAQRRRQAKAGAEYRRNQWRVRNGVAPKRTPEPADPQELRDRVFQARFGMKSRTSVKIKTMPQNKGIMLCLHGTLPTSKTEVMEVLLPFRFMEIARSKYTPHQGQQEQERRRERDRG